MMDDEHPMHEGEKPDVGVEEVPNSGSQNSGRKNKKSKKSKNDEKKETIPDAILSDRSENILSGRSEQITSGRSEQILSNRSEPVLGSDGPKPEVKEKKSKSKKVIAAAPPPQTELQIELKRVEEKLKAREKIKFTILSIELTGLPSAHRFVKNQPWVKGFYGKNYTWVAEYVEGSPGDSAYWKDLNWSISLERNVPDRSDLVLTVCTKYLIIGRYVLGREEFSNIPNTKSGYFEISGDVINGGGSAGQIKLLCLRQQGPDHPPAAAPTTTAVAPTVAATAMTPPVGPSPRLDIGHNEANVAVTTPEKLQIQPDYYEPPMESLEPPITVVMIQLISIAVVDLKSVHMIENNSPQVTVECAEWVGITDVVRGAGIAARWNGLNWKFLMRKEGGIVVTVKSNNILIGKVYMSYDEVTTSAPKSGTTIFELIKHLTNGKEISGRVKINLTMNFSHDAAYAVDPTVSQLPALPQFTPNKINTVSLAQQQQKLNTGLDLNWSPQAVPQKSGIRPPFNVLVENLTVLDVVKIHYLFTNSLSVNAACGSWGCSTEEVVNAGHFAHWINLNWKISVIEGSYFRITVWSRGTTIGSATLNVEQLLGMPTDVNGNTELFAKLLNNRSEIVGKVKIACRYEQAYDQPQKHLNLFLNNIANTPLINDVGEEVMDKEDEAEEEPGLREDVQFPLLVVVKLISLYDLTAVHKLVKNSPRVKIICDRKSATTNAVSGGEIAAKWVNLNWAMIVREESNLVVEVTSGSVLIGSVVLNPVELTTIPVNAAGFTELKLQINNKRASTGKLQLLLEVQNLDEGGGSGNGEAKDDVTHSSGLGLFHDISDEASRMLRSETLPNLFANQYTNQPIKVFDPNLLLAGNAALDAKMAFKVSIHEIDITNLVKVHTLKKNSPFVSAACGKWTAVTKPIDNVAGSCYWTNLGWEFILRNNVNLRLIVNSRTIAVGTSSFNCQAMITPASDHNGIKRIVMNIDNGLVSVGQIKLTYGITVMDARTDKHLLDEAGGGVSVADRSQQQRRTAGGGVGGHEESDYIEFPFDLTVVDISTVELKSAHFLVKNRPRVKLLCDQFYSETAENLSIYGGFDVSIWKDVNWNFPVLNADSTIKVFVDSGGTSIGSGTIDAKQLILIPKDNIGIRECVISISNTVDGLQTTGKVKLSMKFTSLTHNQNGSIYDDNYSQNESTILPPLGPQHSHASGGYFPVPQSHIMQNPHTTSSQGINSQYYGVHGGGGGSGVLSGVGGAGSVVMHNGIPDYSYGNNSGGVMGGGSVMSGGGGGIGIASGRRYSQPAVYNNVTNSPGQPPLRKTGPQSVQQSSTQYQQPQNGFMAAPIPSGILDASGSVHISPTDEFKLKLVSISAIDLLPVHNFAANSPVANIACGKFSGATEECEKAGKQVAWENLNFVFQFETNATLRILVSSKGKTIGNCNISRAKLLNGKRNKNELFTIFSELMQRDSIPAGKIKIVYDIGFGP